MSDLCPSHLLHSLAVPRRYFLHEWVHRTTGRLPTTLVADFVFRIPFFSWLVRLAGGVPASRAATLRALAAGKLVIVAPGGVREGMTPATEDYTVRWFGRKGFAEVVAAAGVPIVPLFTRGIREVFLVVGGSSALAQSLYRRFRLPFTPFIGPVPQPLTSVAGAPITPNPTLSAAQLADIVRGALESLMRVSTSDPCASSSSVTSRT